MLKTKKEIENWLKKLNISQYFIHDNLVVDVDCSVVISRYQLDSIPVQFGTIDGDFYCGYNQLISLKGSPFKVNGEFDCSSNLLTSLKYSPKSCYNFDCSHNAFKYISYLHLNIENDFYCSHNDKQKIEDLSSYYFGDLYAQENILEIKFFILKQYFSNLKLKEKLDKELPSERKSSIKIKL